MTTQMTLTEKILAPVCKKKEVCAGEIIEAEIDWCMTNDATTHISIDLFIDKIRNKNIKNPKKTIFVIDHNVPSESVKTTGVHNKMRRFSKDYGLILHDGEGICHQILLEKYISPGEVIVGADSHTCSYGAIGAFGTGVGSTDLVAAMVTGKTWFMVPKSLKFNMFSAFQDGVFARDLILKIIGDIGCDGATYMAMEFGGPAIKAINIDGRIVLCNMAVEAGAKNGIIEADEITRSYLEEIRKTNIIIEPLISDPDANYEKVYNYDISSIEPAVVGPDFVDRYNVVTDVKGTKIDQGFIGSCNSGRIEDMRVAAKILKGKKIKPLVKLLISPASQDVYLKALSEGLIEIFVESGAIILNPNCSVCWGACQGVIGEKEVMISTGTRNFKGRAGSADSVIYLASVATVAASCLEGKVVDPRNYI